MALGQDIYFDLHLEPKTLIRHLAEFWMIESEVSMI
jgi:aspartyl/asparaginyl-tRNA synthetase